MLIAKNRLPRQIIGNSQEVEKLVVSGTTWFDATSTIPVEGSPNVYEYGSRSGAATGKMTGDMIRLPPGKKSNILYKDSEGYCYVIDTSDNTIKRFNTTLTYIGNNNLKDKLVVFDASDASISILNGTFDYLEANGLSPYNTNSIIGGPKLQFCKYLPIVINSLDDETIIVNKSNKIQVQISGTTTTTWYLTSTAKEAPQYNILVKNQGSKDYTLNAKVGRLILITTGEYVEGAGNVEYGTITLESDDSWLDTKEQVFIDGTQS